MKEKRDLTFSKTMFLNNSEGRVCVFAPNVRYTVSDLRTDYKMNWIHFSYNGELFEFVPLNDTKIELP